MDIQHTLRGDVAVIHLVGQFGYSDEKRLTDLAGTIAEKTPSTIAVDVSKVDYVNSIGIASLFAVMKAADDINSEFVIFGMNQNVMVILEKVFENDFVPLLSEEEFTRKYLS
ncbi:MAG: STAS domain-containing protein [Spirochaetes bacterium]|nr:STAS domain-containing protein [Spirochaetota bacterium]HPA72724.1 STAS domain-containing protein [Spirochaetota bacterium]